MKNKFQSLSIVVILLNILLFSCKGTPRRTEPVNPILKVKSSIGFPAEGGTESLDVISDSDWDYVVTNGKEWLTATKDSSKKTLVLTAKLSAEKNSRTALVQLSNKNGAKARIRIVQIGSDMQISFASGEQTIQIPALGNKSLTLEIISNTKYKIIIPEEAKSWIVEEPSSALRSNLVTTRHIFSINPNTTGIKRETTIRAEAILNTEVYGEISISQSASTSEVSEVEMSKDVKLNVTSGTASENQPDEGIENSFDGNTGGNKIYHSRWKGTQFPVTLEYFFDGNSTPLDYIIYHSRNGNGNFGQFELWIRKADQQEYEKFGEYDFNGAGGAKQINVHKEGKTITPSAIKFVVKSGLNNFVSCAEMEFFHRPSDSATMSSILKVFTDRSCRELKKGATDEDIKALSPFFQEIAKKLRDDTYPADERRFRIQTLKAYSTPEYWAEKLRTNPYTHLNNPLGIITEANEEIVVLVDGLGFNSAFIRCCSGIGHNGTERPIRDGVNKISFPESGNLFLVYEANDPRTLPAIHLHIPPQANEGREHALVGFNLFDLSIDKTNERYREYLKKSKRYGEDQCIFVLKGEKVIFTVRKDLLAAQDAQKGYGVVDGLKRWDEIMGWEQDLAKIDESSHGGAFNNLMHVTTFPDGLYATHYHINMASGKVEDTQNPNGWGFKNNFDPRDMDKAQDNQWGVGHELGHMHQGAINWPSTTESSNNLFSNYVVYKIGKWGSRGSSLTRLATLRYAPRTPWVRFMHPLIPGSDTQWQEMGDGDDNRNGLYQGEDSEMHMRLNQQLWTYFDRCGYQPGFMQKVFTQGRTQEFMMSWRNPGQDQLTYAKNVAKAANMDMTEFFDAWGFFQPVSQFVLRAYGTHNYLVTQQMIDETIRYMRQFPAKCPPIQYIEDRKYSENAPEGNAKGISKNGADVGYFETFKNRVKITKSVTYTVSGRHYSVHDGDQAVAFELRKDGEVVWFSNRFVFDVPDKAQNIEGAELYAVQYDGVRIKASRK